MSPKLVTVVGATGAQGGGIVDLLLKDPNYSVRAITRNPQSETAKALAAKGAEVVAADADSVPSLIAAFQGSHAIFAVTNFFEPFMRFDLNPDKAVETEVLQGINLAKAASATPTLEHYIWSTLPSSKKISGGKYSVPHFEGKVKIDEHIKSDKALHAKTTFLWVTFYASNLDFPMYRPYFIPTGQTYIQLQSTPADTPIFSIGDVRKNLPLVFKAVIEQPEKTRGQYVVAYSEKTNSGEFLQTWASENGHKAVYVQVSRDTFNSVWPGWSEELGVMMEFWDEYRDLSWSGEEGLLTPKDLGVTGFSSVKEGVKGLKY